MSDEGGMYASLSTVDDSVIHEMNPKVSNTETLAYTIFGECLEKFVVRPPIPEDYEFGKRFWEYTRGLLAVGRSRQPSWM